MPSITSDKKLSQYDVGREIGKGAMGTVFLGYDPVTKVRNATLLDPPRQLLMRSRRGQAHRKL